MIRRVLLCVAMVFGVGLATPAAPAQAFFGCPFNHDCMTTYFSGPDYTELVGWYDINCVGEETSSGIVTQWTQFVDHPCG